MNTEQEKSLVANEHTNIERVYSPKMFSFIKDVIYERLNLFQSKKKKINLQDTK